LATTGGIKNGRSGQGLYLGYDRQRTRVGSPLRRARAVHSGTLSWPRSESAGRHRQTPSPPLSRMDTSSRRVAAAFHGYRSGRRSDRGPADAPTRPERASAHPARRRLHPRKRERNENTSRSLVRSLRGPQHYGCDRAGRRWLAALLIALALCGRSGGPRQPCGVRKSDRASRRRMLAGPKTRSEALPHP
jgi:hypothetical protein